MLIRQLVAQAVGLRKNESARERQGKLRSRVAHVCGANDAERVSDFLGEIIDLPAVSTPSPQFRAALNDPHIMATWLERSFIEWLVAEASTRPYLIVLEDLHWGDQLSVNYLNEASSAVAARPVMILALARGEVPRSLPRLWPSFDTQELSLGRLAPRAAARFVRTFLPEIEADALAAIVDRANGNAFFLEELIRCVAQGDAETLPETVLALVQSRIERLDPELRRVLRAASIFGNVFWQNGIVELTDALDVEDALRSLVGAELVVPIREARFPGEREFAFRHDYLRESAYVMLTDTDRVAGHRLAAAWLERVGEKDALTLAKHFELGGHPDRAASCLVRAAQVELDAGNMDGVIELGERAAALGLDDDGRGVMRGLEAQAMGQRGDLGRSVEAGVEAMTLLPPGSPDWFYNCGLVMLYGSFVQNIGATVMAIQAILSTPILPGPKGPIGLAFSTGALALASGGELGQAVALIERAEAFARGTPDDDALFDASLTVGRGYVRSLADDLGSALTLLREARALYDQIGHGPGRASSGFLIGWGYTEAGNWKRAESTLRDLRALCDATGMHVYTTRSQLFVGMSMLYAERISDAISVLESIDLQIDMLFTSAARALLAHAFLAKGDTESSVRLANESLDTATAFPAVHAVALGALALVHLRSGDAAKALATAQEARALAHRGAWPHNSSVLGLVRAEALLSLGNEADARVAIREARDRILRIRRSLPDEDLRQSYVTEVCVNARTLRLADELLA